jgi:Zn-dependent metalloprotease
MAAASSATKSCVADPVVMYRQSGPTQKFVCIENGCFMSSDQVAVHLYKTVKQVQQFFLQVFKLCGVDGKGKTVPFTVGWDEQNAAWTCEGSSCRWKFNDSLAIIPEVAAHEIAHAVVQYSRSTPLTLSGQSGALNESIANVLAIAFRHWSERSGWNIGNLYDLSAPTDMSQFKTGTEDSGHIHANSNIPSHAFCLAVDQSKTPSYGIIGHIWFSAMSQVSSNASFVEFAYKTVNLTPQASSSRNAVVNAWLRVGVFRLVVPKPVAAAAPAPQKSWLQKLLGF